MITYYLPELYQLRFRIENKYDRVIYINSTLLKPYDQIKIGSGEVINFAFNNTSTGKVELRAYEFNTKEPLTINDKFKVELYPQPAPSSVISLAVPSLEYRKSCCHSY